MHASHTRVKALDGVLHWQPSNTLDFMVSGAESASGDNSVHMQTLTVINLIALNPVSLPKREPGFEAVKIDHLGLCRT